MNRSEEYRALQRELETPPAALEYTVQRAKARAKRRTGRRLFRSLGSAAAVFALFAVLVNVSAPFASACERIPILKELAAAVSFSPSLSAAVEHNYAQKIDQSQTENGITMTLEYLMLDDAQIIIFVTLTGPEQTKFFELHPDLTLPDGSELEGCGVISHSIPPDELSNAITIAITKEDFTFPETLHMECPVRSYIPGVTSESDRTPDAVFSFDIPLDSRYLNQSRTIALNQWAELDGNRIKLVSLDIYPTHARLNIQQDAANTEILQTMEFYLEDENGVHYKQGSASGLSALGDCYLFETPFFNDPKQLALCITEAAWLDPARQYVTLDLERGTACSPMPDSVSVSVHHSGRNVNLALIAPDPPGNTETYHRSYQVYGGSYRSPDGTVHEINQFSSMTSNLLWRGTEDETAIPDGYFISEITLPNYSYDTVELELYFSRRAVYDTPVRIPLF